MTRYRVWRIRINLIAMSTTGEEASIWPGLRICTGKRIMEAGDGEVEDYLNLLRMLED